MRSELLKNLRIASPCHVGWENMTGDDRIRFCDSCQLNVYNLSEMTPHEVESLIVKAEGRVCGRMYKRADGTVLTRDCPVGIRAVRKKVARFATSVFATIISLCGVALPQSKQSPDRLNQHFKLEIVLPLGDSKAGTLSGIVTDAFGVAIAGAEVSFRESKADKAILVKTNQDGRFTFSGLTDGTYEIKVASPGFVAHTISNIQISSTKSYRAEISLNIGALSGLLVIEAPLESPGGQMTLELAPTRKSSITKLPAVKH